MGIVLSHQDYYDRVKASHARHHAWRKTLGHRARNVFHRVTAVNCFVCFVFQYDAADYVSLRRHSYLCASYSLFFFKYSSLGSVRK